LRFEPDYPDPAAKPGEALVAVKACGICGSDVSRVFSTGTYSFPTIIGHEFSGEVVGVNGEAADRGWIGKRVAVFPLMPCRKCEPCAAGDYQLCKNYNYLGSRCNGGDAEYVSVPLWNLFEISETVTFPEAAMFEPAAVALHALRQAAPGFRSSIVIFGTGTIASIQAQLALRFGAGRVIIAGRNPEKLAFIRDVAEGAITVDTRGSDFIEELAEITHGGADVAIEGTGDPTVLATAINAVRSKGSVVLMGNPHDNMPLEKQAYWQIMRKELRMSGTWNSSYGSAHGDDWRDAHALLCEKKLNLAGLITQTIALPDLMRGLLIMKEKTVFANKVMVSI
jgi:L-iditol 2-dehydrogenase